MPFLRGPRWGRPLKQLPADCDGKACCHHCKHHEESGLTIVSSDLQIVHRKNRQITLESFYDFKDGGLGKKLTKRKKPRNSGLRRSVLIFQLCIIIIMMAMLRSVECR